MSAIGDIFRALGNLYDAAIRKPAPRTQWYCEECDDDIRPGEMHYSTCSCATVVEDEP